MHRRRVLANLMFEQPAIAWSTTDRATPAHLLAEVVATAGLVIVIFLLARQGKVAAIPVAVAAYIGAAYFFTSSTSFANPAITIGRMFTDTFAGIAPGSRSVVHRRTARRRSDRSSPGRRVHETTSVSIAPRRSGRTMIP